MCFVARETSDVANSPASRVTGAGWLDSVCRAMIRQKETFKSRLLIGVCVCSRYFKVLAAAMVVSSVVVQSVEVCVGTLGIELLWKLLLWNTSLGPACKLARWYNRITNWVS